MLRRLITRLASKRFGPRRTRPLSSRRSAFLRRRSRGLRVEPLEERTLLAGLTIAIAEASIGENGGAASAIVSRDWGTSGDLVVELVSSDVNSATVPPTVTIPNGQDSAAFTITGVDEAVVDITKTITITASATGFDPASDTLDVTNDDRATLTVGDATVVEGDSGTTLLSFPVTLDLPVDVDVSVDYATQDGTARAADDYVPVTTRATLAIKAGEMSEAINVTINGDTTVEPNETLRLLLSNLQSSGRDVTLDMAEWVQIGQELDGESAGDRSGFSVAVSGDGNTIVVGATGNDGNGNNSGHARVYRFDGTNWTQFGQDIDGESADDVSGASVAISDHGNTVAIGAPLSDGNGTDSGQARVYRFDGTKWTQLGQDINGDVASDNSGSSVSLSGDGNTLVIGAPDTRGAQNVAGRARVYRIDGTTWVQLGQDIDGENAGDRFGASVSVSDDGNTVAIGAYYNDGNGTDSGHVRVLSFDGTNWIQLGQDIDGEAAENRFGESVSLSGDGRTVIVGAPFNDSIGTNSGQARVYRFDGTSWAQLGEDINGEAVFDQSGNSVSMSDDGNVVVIGARYNDSVGNSVGHARVYRYNGINWNQIGHDIDGEANGDLSGWSVSVSGDGNTAAIGAPFNDGNGIYSGHARVFRLQAVAIGTITNDDRATLSVGNATVVEGDSGTTLLSFPVTLDAAVDVDVSVDYITQDVTANAADGDYIPVTTPATLTIPASETSGTIHITINGDLGVEGDETLSVQLSNLQASHRDVALALTDWVQLGQDINGEAAGDYSGRSVALSRDGSTVAIGAPYNQANGWAAGHVRVYRFDGSNWTQLGRDIDGTPFDYAGSSVSLSADGNILAVGGRFGVDVYRFFRSHWMRLGVGISWYDLGGNSVISTSLSDEGSTLVIGGYGRDLNAGRARIYRFDSLQWNQLGQDIDGEAMGDASGASVALSSDGNTVAIGAPFNDGNETDAGHTRVYQLEDSTWHQIGQDIYGEVAGDESGTSVSLNADSSILVIGAPKSDGNGFESGQARVYRFDGTNWEQIGQEINGGISERFGRSVSLSDDGNTVLIGALFNARNIGAGARVYRFDGVHWAQVGDINGQPTYEVDWAVSLNGVGDTLVIGAYSNDNGVASGEARLYQLGPAAKGTINDNDSVLVEFNQATGMDVESSGGSLPQILVTGTIHAGYYVVPRVAAVNGTATGDGLDYSTPIAAVIPAGIYNATLVAVSRLSIVPDSLIESDETIELEILPGNQVRVGDANGDGVVQATTLYTILDDDLQNVRTAVELGDESILTIRDFVPGGKNDRLELTIVGDRLVVTDRNNILGNFGDNTTGNAVDVPLAAIRGIEIDLAEGDDALTIDFSGAPQGLNLSLTINGGDGHDTLTFAGPMLLDAGELRANGDVEDIFVNGPITMQSGTIALDAAESLEVNANIRLDTGSMQLTAGRDVFGNCSLIQAGDADVNVVTGTGIGNVRIETTGDVLYDAGSGGIVGCPSQTAVRAETLTLVAGTSVGTALMIGGQFTSEAPLLTSVNTIQGTVGGMGLFLRNDGPLTDNVVLTAAAPFGVRHVCPGLACSVAAAEGPPLQNPANRLDVNDDRAVSPVDVLGVFNYLNRMGAAAQPEGTGKGHGGMYVDVNGDRTVSALDALIVINAMNSRTAAHAEGELAGPSSLVLNGRISVERNDSSLLTRQPSGTPQRMSREQTVRLPVAEACGKEGGASPSTSDARRRAMSLEDKEAARQWDSLLGEIAEDSAAHAELTVRKGTPSS